MFINAGNTQFRTVSSLGLKNFQLPRNGGGLSGGAIFPRTLEMIHIYKDMNITGAFEILKTNKFTIKEINTYAHSLIVTTKISRFLELAAHPFVHFIAPIDPPSYPENKTARTLHRSNVINAEYTNGRHYNGEGVNIMMQDDGAIGPHIDYQGRIDQSAVSNASFSAGPLAYSALRR